MSIGSGESTAGAPVVDSPVLVGEPAAGGRRRRAGKQRAPGERAGLAVFFLAPAFILLAAILLYPLIYSIVRSLFGDTSSGAASSFIGLSNYKHIFTNSDTLRAVRNNVLWVLIVPTVVTILGLMFAVLSERIRWATVFKTILFMPMAISFLASAITFDLIYADQPSRGLANAVAVGIHDTFEPSSKYAGLHPRDSSILVGSDSAGYTTRKTYAPGTAVLLPMTGMNLQAPPSSAHPAKQPANGPGLTGAVWNDFKLGGGGKVGAIDPGELGLGGATVQAVQDGKVVASTKADSTGDFSFPTLKSGQYALKLPASNFAAAYGGESWLGPNLITPAIMIAYLWIYAGFAMVLLAAGMSALPRDVMEAARVDGATEWQVFRRVTAPLLAPVLLVVFVTLVINVLKVFDIVYVIEQAAGANAKYGDVLAVSLYKDFGNQQYGVASAIGVLLVLFVIPAMVSNIRRFRREQ